MTTKTFSDFHGNAIAIGDRVIPLGWGEGEIPLWLSTTPAVVVGYGRTRIKVKFEGVSYGGKFAEFDSIPCSYVRVLDGDR